MSATRHRQRMAPGMLTDSVLESMLRNKVPVRLQEIKEITVGSVQELLQKLLCVELVVQERNRWLNKKQNSTSAPRRSRAPVKNCELHVLSTIDISHAGHFSSKKLIQKLSLMYH